MATKQNARMGWERWLKHLGQRLSVLRDESGLTNDEIAHRCGVTRWTVSRWFAGSYAPRINHLYILAGLWDVDVEQLVPSFRIGGK